MQMPVALKSAKEGLNKSILVIPGEAKRRPGIQCFLCSTGYWFPAFAGMTSYEFIRAALMDGKPGI